MKNSKHVEITDFGLSGLIQNDITTPYSIPYRWVAMECLKDPKKNLYCEATDVWSFGITCWEILTFARPPYEDVDLGPPNVMQSLYNYLNNGNRLPRPERCSLELFETLLLCWAPKHTSRPNFKTLKETFNKYNDTPNRFVLTKKPTNDIEMNNQAFIKVYEDAYRKENESKNRKNSYQLESEQVTGQGFEQEISNHSESEQDDSNIHNDINKDFNSIKEYLYSNPNNEGSSHRCDEDELDNSNNDVLAFGLQSKV
uniref:Protein kinase domain-containing protein n=1 Tax=Acrobeloides nanus TaxID=290746 RepID=A0A914C884_9BILA